MTNYLGRVFSGSGREVPRMCVDMRYGRGLRTGRSTGQELLHSLMGQSEDVGGVAHAESALLDEGPCGFSSRAGGRLLDGLSLGSLLAGPFDGRSHRFGEADVLDEGESIRGGLEPQGGGVADMVPGLCEGAPIGVYPGLLHELDEPEALLVALEGRRVAHGHRSHPFPRQGSRSRSMLRRVPGRMSPPWIGTVV